LVVSDEHQDFDPEILKSDPVEERSEEVADVKWAGGTISRENPESAGGFPYGRLERAATALGNLE
jgi:hypothetical protein